MNKFEPYIVKKAFTLAEVLITLVVIGIVAALSIPSLLQNTQNAERVAALKKAYSSLSQAYIMLIADGESMQSLFSTGDAAPILNVFGKKVSFIKNCGSGEMGCFPHVDYKFLNGASGGYLDVGMSVNISAAVLADGISILLARNSSCNVSIGSLKICGAFYVDVNGSKPPNQSGRDLFLFWVATTGIFPAGSNNDGYFCDPAGASNNYTIGWGCAKRVLEEGAMNY